MYCIVLRNYNGEHFRHELDEKPTLVDVKYWEDYHSIHIGKHNGPYYDNTHTENAVVINVFEVES